MSIYRGYRPLPSDVQVAPVNAREAAEPVVATPIPHHLRRARPALVVFPRTAVWMSLLPPPVQPKALASKYARIANAVCAMWNDAPACRRYLAQLMTDDRGGRQGFPTPVLREIEILRRYHEHLDAPVEGDSKWNDSYRSLWDGPERKSR